MSDYETEGAINPYRRFSLENKTPMRIREILDKLDYVVFHSRNYVSIIYNIRRAVKKIYPNYTKSSQEQLCVEVLGYIPELNPLSDIHISSVHFSFDDQNYRGEIKCCNIG